MILSVVGFFPGVILVSAHLPGSSSALVFALLSHCDVKRLCSHWILLTPVPAKLTCLVFHCPCTLGPTSWWGPLSLGLSPLFPKVLLHLGKLLCFIFLLVCNLDKNSSFLTSNYILSLLYYRLL